MTGVNEDFLRGFAKSERGLGTATLNWEVFGDDGFEDWINGGKRARGCSVWERDSIK